MEEIRNDELILTTDSFGAEMQSLRDARTGEEYIWQGAPDTWSGHSPILFPIVGGLWDGTCREGGRELHIPKHGVVRRRPWQLSGRTATTVTYAIESDAETLATFPHDFRVEVTYHLAGRRLCVVFRVENTGLDTMWFQLGGHPAFVLPDFNDAGRPDGYVRLHGSVESRLMVGRQGCTRPERYAAPCDADGRIALGRATFDDESLIFDRHQVTRADLLRADGSRRLTVESDAPVWLLWSPQGEHVPFTCIEPWYGLCDEEGFAGTIEARPYINHTAPGEEWEGGYTIDVAP